MSFNMKPAQRKLKRELDSTQGYDANSLLSQTIILQGEEGGNHVEIEGPGDFIYTRQD